MASVVALIDGKPGAYGISFPDFPGCVAGGKTVDEALVRGREGLAFHIEGMREVGEAQSRLRDIAQIRADAEFAEDFKDAMVALVDIEVGGRAVRVQISMDEYLLGRVDSAAEAVGETRSGYIAGAVRARISGAWNAPWTGDEHDSCPRCYAREHAERQSESEELLEA